ncbi:Mitochondrial/chloroplast ribosomal protein L54/L37 [Mycena venus]|uniref:Large ribosomal subunit protein mL54 n=1 Tax=Mycena venus TaxID=2733690 RepID=A0A8H6Y0G7_9AGAR|nr:Mitochondrial/chloroplast ribosomal protein L54/L37 [Mycena venus]
MSLSTILRRSSCIALGPRTRTYASNAAAKSSPKGAQKAPPQSSCAPDTVITGANYLKGQPPVLALPDEEYPAWLWTVLEERVWPDDGPGGRGRASRPEKGE